MVKYDNLPGDYDSIITTAATAGDADGTIEQASDEGSKGLRQLADADMGGLVTATYEIIPEATIDTAGWTLGSRAESKNVVALIGAAGFGLTGANINIAHDADNVGITGDQAFSIDRKMDDGAVATGSVRATLAGDPTVGTAVDCGTGNALATGCNVTFDL